MEQQVSGEVEAARQDALYVAEHARPAAVDALIAAVRAEAAAAEATLERAHDRTIARLTETEEALEASRQEVEALKRERDAARQEAHGLRDKLAMGRALAVRQRVQYEEARSKAEEVKTLRAALREIEAHEGVGLDGSFGCTTCHGRAARALATAEGASSALGEAEEESGNGR